MRFTLALLIFFEAAVADTDKVYWSSRLPYSAPSSAH